MSRHVTVLGVAIIVLTLARTEAVRGNGQDFFPAAEGKSSDLVYFGRIKDRSTGHLIRDRAFFTIFDSATGMNFPFMNDSPAHYRSPDVGAAIKELDRAVSKLGAKGAQIYTNINNKPLDNPEFTRRNVIAVELEKVIDALVSLSFNRDSFLRSLDRFYRAIEEAARGLEDFSEKQHFLNTVYERFFQGYSVKVDDTHGIVYTPQEIVDFMCASVAEVL